MRKVLKRFPFNKVFVCLFISLYTLLPSAQAVGTVVEDYATEDITVETEVDTSEDILDEGISDPEEIANPEVVEEEIVAEEAEEPLFVYEDGVYTVHTVVEGEKYLYPDNDDVSVKFTSISEEGNLIISKVLLTEEKKEELNTSDDYGWDISSSMSNGSFTYDLTLPNTLGNDVEVKYTEDGEIYNSVEGIVSEDVIHIYGLEHFTMFVVTFEEPQDPSPTYAGYNDVWFDWDGTITRVPSGTNGISSSEGDFHAEITGGAYTWWGGRRSTFPEFGYDTRVDIYLDMSLADGSDKRFDFSSAIYKPDETHRRDFIFNLGTDPNSPESWLISASNNAPGWPGNPNRNPVSISDTGWYTLEHQFRSNENDVLVVTFNIYKKNNSVPLGTWVLSNETDIIGETVGGNGYGWFLNLGIPWLAIDNSILVEAPNPCPDIINNTTNNTYCSIQEAIDEADNGDTITVKDGTYEPIVINKSISLINSSSPVIACNGSGNGILIQASDVTIDGFEIINCKNGIRTYGGPSDFGNLTVKNTNIHDNSQNAILIVFDFFDTVTFENLDLYNNGQNAIGIANDAAIENLLIHSSNIRDNNHHGLLIAASLIGSVDILDSSFVGSKTNGYSGLTIATSPSQIGDLKIDKGLFNNNKGSGISITQVPSLFESIHITSSEFKANSESGIMLGGGSSTNTIRIETSTFGDNGWEDLDLSGGWFGSFNVTNKAEILKNEFYPSAWAKVYVGSAGTINNLDINYNNFHGAQSAVFNTNSVIANVDNNWWNSLTGPGGKLSGNATYDNWLCEPYKTDWVSIDGSCAMREIGFGYGSGINGEPSDPGMCNVYTNDTSLPGNKALQVLQFHTLSGAEYYMIQGYKWNGSSWVASGNPYNPEEYAAGKTTVEFSIDNGIATYQTGATNQGIYTYQILAYSMRDNLVGQSSIIVPEDLYGACKFTVDRTPPEPPVLTGDPVQYVNWGDVTRSWLPSSSTDVDYYMYKNITNAWISGPYDAGESEYNITHPTGSYDRIFEWQVLAVDFAGNETWSEDIYKVVVDGTKPTVEITNVDITDKKLSFTVSGTDNLSGARTVGTNIYNEDNTGPAVIEIGRLAHNITPKTLSVSYDATGIDLSGLESGTYTIRAAIRDYAGNLEFATYQIEVDNTPPSVPTATLTANGLSVLTNGYTNSETFTFNLTSADSVRYQLKYWNDISGSSFKESTPWNPTDLSAYSSTLGVYNDKFTQGEGKHYFAFSACDIAGNCSDYSTPFVVTYDKTAPTSTITSPSDGYITNETPEIVGNTEDTYSVDQVVLSYTTYDEGQCGTEWTELITLENTEEDLPFDWSYDGWNLEDGNYCIKAQGTDLAGNEENTAIVENVIYDTTAPTISLMEIITGLLSVTSEDILSGKASVEVKIDGVTDWEPYTEEMNLNDLVNNEPGTYTVYVKVTDNAGNVTEDSTFFTIPSPTPTTVEEVLGAVASPKPAEASGTQDPVFTQATGTGGPVYAQTTTIEEDTDIELDTSEEEDTTGEEAETEVKGTEDEEVLGEEDQEGRPWWVYPLIILPLLLLFIILWKRRKEDEQPQY